jgi:CubicO group peptidase (beta-lactamase class C family)
MFTTKTQENLMKILLTLLFVALNLGFAQNTLDPDISKTIDSYINEQLSENLIPGISLAVVQDGKVIYAKGYGYANLEHEVAAKPETVYQLASVSKQFTAAGVMLLVEDGKIELDESIKTYLTDAPESWQNITVRQLLNHTAGLGDYPYETFDFRQPKTEDEILNYIYQSELMFEPESRFSYSNFGYITLSILISKVSGQSFGDFMTERIFAPLDMSATTVISEQDIVMNRAQGYEREVGEDNQPGVKNQTWVNPSLNIFGDGAFYSTVLDMAKWDAALYGTDILSQESKETLWKPLTLSNGNTYPLVEAYGMGWSVGTVNSHAFVEHSGGWQGFATHFLRFLDDRLSVVVLANLNLATSSEIARQVAALINPELALQSIEDEPEISSLINTVLEDLFTGELKPDMFTTGGLVISSELQTLIQENASALGAVQEATLLERENTSGDYVLYTYDVTLENVDLRLELVLNAEQKIANLILE